MNEYLHCSLMNKHAQKNPQNTPKVSNNCGVALNVKSEHYAIIKILIMEEGMGS